MHTVGPPKISIPLSHAATFIYPRIEEQRRACAPNHYEGSTYDDEFDRNPDALGGLRCFRKQHVDDVHLQVYGPQQSMGTQ